MILSSPKPLYVGRFAPSPTGPLHLGSLYTALASYLDARAHHGLWLLRIDDLDSPRNVPGATDAILRCLTRFELNWDGEVYIESQHRQHYQAALADLLQQQWLYACGCSRKKLANASIYPGYCREAHLAADNSTALRLKCRDLSIAFEDVIQGNYSQNLAREQGDFIVLRRDQIVAYQFAVVVDDHLQGITHVVRGSDLLDSTPKQIYLQQLLHYPLLQYLHLPVIVDQQGNKLSKQTLAAPVDEQNPAALLFFLLQLLKQNPPSCLRMAPTSEQLAWGIAHWRPQTLRKIRTIHPPAQ